MLRVLHVVKTLDLGGAETNLLNLATASSGLRKDLHVAYCGNGRLVPLFKKHGIKLFQYSLDDPNVASIETIPIIYRFARYILRNDIQLIHTHVFSPHIWGTIAGHLTRTPIIEHVHDSRYQIHAEFLKRGETNRQFKHIERFRNTSTRTVVLTELNQRVALERRINHPSRIRKIHNGIPLELPTDHNLTRAVRDRFGIEQDAFVSVTPIRMTPEKNCSRLLEIIFTACSHNSNLAFVIAGDGPLFPDLRQQVSASGFSSRIILPGYVNEMRPLLSASDALFLPSLLELNSVAIMEALSVGLPVVVSQNVGFNSEILEHEVSALLNDPFRIEGWVDSLCSLEENPNLRLEIAKAGHKVCRTHLDINRCIREFDELYTQVLEENETRSIVGRIKPASFGR